MKKILLIPLLTALSVSAYGGVCPSTSEVNSYMKQNYPYIGNLRDKKLHLNPIKFQGKDYWISLWSQIPRAVRDKLTVRYDFKLFRHGEEFWIDKKIMLYNCAYKSTRRPLGGEYTVTVTLHYKLAKPK